VPRFVNYNTRPESPHSGEEHKLTVIWNEHKHPRPITDSNILSLHWIYFKIAFALNDMATGISLFYKTLIYGYQDSHLSTQGLRSCSALYVPNHLLDFVADFNTANAGSLCGQVQRSQYSNAMRAGRSGDRIQVLGEIFRNRPDRPWGPPNVLPMGTVSFPWVKRPGRGVCQPPPSSAEVNKKE